MHRLKLFCDYDIEKVEKLVSMLESTDNINQNSDVFISYCSAQREYADCLRKMLTERGVKCWMAPYSIPTGSSYQTEIPSALSNTPNVLLVLSKEAETSRWVQKEWCKKSDFVRLKCKSDMLPSR